MQTNIELEQLIHKIISELNNCVKLLGKVHPKLKPFADKAIKEIGFHIMDMDILLDLCKKELDESDKVIIQNVINATLKMLSQSLQVACTLLEYTAKLQEL